MDDTTAMEAARDLQAGVVGRRWHRRGRRQLAVDHRRSRSTRCPPPARRERCDPRGRRNVRSDDPALTVRHVDGDDPLRVVLGSAPPSARVHPCIEWDGSLEGLLDELGARGVLQLMVEGGAGVVGSFHSAGLVNRYVLYLAPALFGRTHARTAIDRATAPTIADIWRGRFDTVERVGDDLCIELIPLLEPIPTEGP